MNITVCQNLLGSCLNHTLEYRNAINECMNLANKGVVLGAELGKTAIEGLENIKAAVDFKDFNSHLNQLQKAMLVHEARLASVITNLAGAGSVLLLLGVGMSSILVWNCMNSKEMGRKSAAMGGATAVAFVAGSILLRNASALAV